EYAYWALGMVQFTMRQSNEAIGTLRRGLQINPNCALIHGTIGNYLAIMGSPDESIVATELSMRINPRDPSIFFRYQALADAYFTKRDFQKTLDWATKTIIFKPNWFGGHLRHIAALALLDRDDEAAVAVERYRREVASEAQAQVMKWSGFIREDDQ